MSQITALMAEHWRSERTEDRKAAGLAFGIGVAFSLIAWACLVRAEYDKGFLFGAVLALFVACGCVYSMGTRLWEAHQLTMSIDEFEMQEAEKWEPRL